MRVLRPLEEGEELVVWRLVCRQCSMFQLETRWNAAAADRLPAPRLRAPNYSRSIRPENKAGNGRRRGADKHRQTQARTERRRLQMREICHRHVTRIAGCSCNNQSILAHYGAEEPAFPGNTGWNKPLRMHPSVFLLQLMKLVETSNHQRSDAFSRHGRRG